MAISTMPIVDPSHHHHHNHHISHAPTAVTDSTVSSILHVVDGPPSPDAASSAASLSDDTADVHNLSAFDLLDHVDFSPPKHLVRLVRRAQQYNRCAARDSLRTRNALLRGKEGTRQRRRWENDHLIGVPNAQPPEPRDFEIHPTHPVRLVPYHLLYLWDHDRSRLIQPLSQPPAASKSPAASKLHLKSKRQKPKQLKQQQHGRGEAKSKFQPPAQTHVHVVEKEEGHWMKKSAGSSATARTKVPAAGRGTSKDGSIVTRSGKRNGEAEAVESDEADLSSRIKRGLTLGWIEAHGDEDVTTAMTAMTTTATATPDASSRNDDGADDADKDDPISASITILSHPRSRSPSFHPRPQPNPPLSSAHGPPSRPTRSNTGTDSILSSAGDWVEDLGDDEEGEMVDGESGDEAVVTGTNTTATRRGLGAVWIAFWGGGEKKMRE